MDEGLTQHYLEGTGMEPPQAEALSRLLGQTVTRSDLLLLEQNIDTCLSSFEHRMETRFLGLERDMDGRFLGLERDMHGRMLSLEQKVEARMVGVEEKLLMLRSDLHAMEAKLMWRFVALLVAFGTIMTVLDVVVQ